MTSGAIQCGVPMTELRFDELAQLLASELEAGVARQTVELHIPLPPETSPEDLDPWPRETAYPRSPPGQPALVVGAPHKTVGECTAELRLINRRRAPIQERPIPPPAQVFYGFVRI